MASEPRLDAPIFDERFIGLDILPGDGWSVLLDEIQPLRKLGDNWDGQGASAPHPTLVDSAINLARRFQAERRVPADRVTAGVNGTIFFSWHLPEGYGEIEVVAPNEAEFRWVPDGSDEAEESTLCW